MAEDGESNWIVGNESVTLAQKSTSGYLREDSEEESEGEEKVEHEEKDDSVCRMIKVTGIPSQVSEDTLIYFFENRRKSGGGDVEEIDYNEKLRTAVITFEDSKDVDRILQKLPFYLEGRQIHVEHYVPDNSRDDHVHIDDATKSSCTIEVRGMTETTSNDTIEFYFESKRAVGACVDIEKIVVVEENGDRVIYITYPCEEDMRRVLQRHHKVNDTELEVKEYILSHSQKPCPLHEDEEMMIGINPDNSGVEKVLETQTDDTPCHPLNGEGRMTVDKTNELSVFEHFGIEECCRSLMLIVNARKPGAHGKDKVETHTGKIKSEVINPTKVQFLLKHRIPFPEHLERDIIVEKVIQESDLQLICVANGKESAKTVFLEIVRHLESEEKKLKINKLQLEMFVSQHSLEQMLQLLVLKAKEFLGEVDIFHDEKEDELLIVGISDSFKDVCKYMEKQGQTFQDFIFARKHILRSKLHAEAMLKLDCEGYIRKCFPTISMCIESESETVIITANEKEFKKCSLLIEKFLYRLKTRRFQVQDEVKCLLENEDTKNYIEQKLLAESIQSFWTVDGPLVKVQCKHSSMAVKAASIIQKCITAETFVTETDLQQIVTHPSIASFMETNANKLLIKESRGKLKVIARQDVMTNVIDKFRKLEVEGISIRAESTCIELENRLFSTTLSDFIEKQCFKQNTGSQNDNSTVHLKNYQETKTETLEMSQKFQFSVKDYEMDILRKFDFESTWKSKYPTKDICFNDKGGDIILKSDDVLECKTMVCEFLRSMHTLARNVSKECEKFLVEHVVTEYVNNVLREETCHCAWFVDENCIRVYGKSDDDVTNCDRIISQCVKEQVYRDQSIFQLLQEKAQFKTLSSIFDGKARMTVSLDKTVLCVTDDIALKAIKKIAMWIAEVKSSIKPGISVYCKKVIFKVDIIGSDGHILDSESKTLKPHELTVSAKQDPDHGPRIQYILQHNAFVILKGVNCRPVTKLAGPILRMNWTLMAESADQNADTLLCKILKNINESCSEVSVQRLPLAGIEFVKSFSSLVSDVLSDFKSLLDTMEIFHDEEKHILLFVSRKEDKENIALQINETMRNVEVYREYLFETEEQGQCVEYFDFSEQLKEMQNVHINVTRKGVRFRGKACDLDVCLEKLKTFLQQIFTSNTSKLSNIVCEILCLDGTKQYIEEELNRKKIRCIWSLDQKEKLVKMFCDRKYLLEKGIKILTMCVEEKKVDMKMYKQLTSHTNFADLLEKGKGKLVIRDNQDPVEIAATDDVMNIIQEIGVFETSEDTVPINVLEMKDDKEESEDTLKAKSSTCSEEQQIVEENFPIIRVHVSEEEYLALKFFYTDENWTNKVTKYENGILEILGGKDPFDEIVLNKIKGLKDLSKMEIQLNSREQISAQNAISEVHDTVPKAFCYQLEREKDVLRVMGHNKSTLQDAKRTIDFFLGRIRPEEERRKTLQIVKDILPEGNKNLFTSCTRSSSNLCSATFATREGLTVRVYVGNILYLDVDCIVNAANENLHHGGGISIVISRAAGYEFERESKDYIHTYGSLSVGECCTTSAGDLKYRGVIHVVGPRWYDYQDKIRCLDDLTKAVRAVMIKCNTQRFTKVAIPCISSGVYGVPKDLCAQQYYRAVTEYSSRDWGGSSSLTEIHFVDKDQDMVDLIVKTFSECYQKDHKMKRLTDFGGDKRIGSKTLSSPKSFSSSPNKLRRIHSRDSKLSVKMEEKIAAQYATHTSAKCGICLDDATDPKKMKCGHIFCRDCIDMHFQCKQVCPRCGVVYGKINEHDA